MDIMFNDNYGLTKAVLEGRKTQTRRIINVGLQYILNGNDDVMKQAVYETSRYKIGERVAIAQSYQDVNWQGKMSLGTGRNNKMFVKAEYMPHHIRITNVRVEHLQDISEEDCLKEGIKASGVVKGYWYVMGGTTSNDKIRRESAHMAYADLIDKTCGKGTWDSNPWVFVYDFELIK